MEMFHHYKSSTFCEDDKSLFYGSTETDSLGDSDFRTINCVNADAEHGKQDNAQDFVNLGGERDLYESAEMVPASCAVSNKTDRLFFDSGSLWDGSESTEPWWRTTDRDELALLVSQRSFGLVENCDLPRPQRTYAKGEAFADFCDGTLTPSKDPKYPGGNHALIKGPMTSVDVSLQAVTTNPLSTVRGAIPKRNIGENDPGKAVLLEALCHSQTRARGAETAAKEAHAEKEHIMKLVFRQASQLFAYKHWFQLLQLESKQNEPISRLLPVMLPWAPQKAKPTKPQKSWQNGCNGKRAKKGRPMGGCLSNYAVAIALGLSLVGAGLLLGWTVGCFLPAF